LWKRKGRKKEKIESIILALRGRHCGFKRASSRPLEGLTGPLGGPNKEKKKNESTGGFQDRVVYNVLVKDLSCERRKLKNLR
jgi:hypothetical protein